MRNFTRYECVIFYEETTGRHASRRVKAKRQRARWSASSLTNISAERYSWNYNYLLGTLHCRCKRRALSEVLWRSDCRIITHVNAWKCGTRDLSVSSAGCSETDVTGCTMNQLVARKLARKRKGRSTKEITPLRAPVHTTISTITRDNPWEKKGGKERKFCVRFCTSERTFTQKNRTAQASVIECAANLVRKANRDSLRPRCW